MPNKNQFSNLTITEYEALRQLLSNVLRTTTTPVVIPSEAMLGIEAIAAGIAAPGRTVLNVVTGPYGDIFGKWLTRGGSEVVEVRTAFNEVANVEEIKEAIVKFKPCAISFVQAEAVTGGTNPTKEILELAREYDLITIIDSVSAIGAEPLLMDEWDVDFVAIGAQKAFAGPNGVSAVGISDRGWAFIESNPNAPRQSILSLLDLKYDPNIGLGGAVPLNIPTLEARALIDALQRIEQEGLEELHRRHQLAASATIAGIKALGLEPWQKHAAAYSPLVTTVKLPAQSTIKIDAPIGIVTPGNGELLNQLLRVNHFGYHANRESVEQALITLAELTGQDPQAALAAGKLVWDNE